MSRDISEIVASWEEQVAAMVARYANGNHDDFFECELHAAAVGDVVHVKVKTLDGRDLTMRFRAVVVRIE